MVFSEQQNLHSAGLNLTSAQKTRSFLLSHCEAKGQVPILILVTNGDDMSRRETRQPDVGGELSVDPF